MKFSMVQHPTPHRKQQLGLSLIEIFIGITIGLFLLAGLVTIFSSTRQNSLTQGQMAQLQDDQRMAMSMLTTIIQQAGYYPSPQSMTAATALPLVAPFVQAGQSITGTTTVGSNSDTVAIRYAASVAGTTSTDAIVNCNGGSNTSTSTIATYVNTFSIDNQNQLSCAVNTGAAQPLVGGISGLSILYGVDPDGNGSVNQYYPASSMTAALWTSVISVRLTLTFKNPLYGQPGQSQTIPFTRVISLMNRS